MADPPRRHSQVAQAAYHDLVSLLLDEEVSAIRGAPTRRERGGRSYWYDRYRVGTATRERYLGEDGPALRDRLARHAALGAAAGARRAERTRLVRLLRGERFLGLDARTGSLAAAMARAGVFRLGGVVVGTAAFRLYEGELGLRLALDDLAMTDDLDIASFERLSLAIGDAAEPTVAEVLAEFAFEPVPAAEAGTGQGKVWRWRQSRGGALVEFLTPSFAEAEGLRPLAALGVSAQALHYLNYLIAEPIHAAGVYRDGVLLRVPRPERFAVHKLIVADRREGRAAQKAEKDRRQAALLIRVLAEDRPGDLAEAHAGALARGPRWRERIGRSLERLPEARAALERAAGWAAGRA